MPKRLREYFEQKGVKFEKDDFVDIIEYVEIEISNIWKKGEITLFLEFQNVSVFIMPGKWKRFHKRLFWKKTWHIDFFYGII